MSMQRKLVLVMVAIAFAAVTLVGAGVLVFAQVGARDDATAAVERQLTALQEIAVGRDGTTLATLEPAIRRLGIAFGDGQLAVVVIDDYGSVRTLPTRNTVPAPTVVGADALTVTDNQVDALRDGETVIIDQPRNVVGLVRLDIPVRPGALGGTPAIWVRQGVGAVSSRATRWFVLSAVIVMLASAVAASWLARRFTTPVRSIERATSAIASGRLDTRIENVGSDELGQLARSVNAMAADLERSRAAEQQFLLSITHDLRTPLTSISGYAEALRDGAVDDPHRAGTIIGSNADRLDRLVGDLLTLARLESKSFTFHPATIDLAVMAGEQRVSAHQRASRLGLSVELEQMPGTTTWIVADPDRTRQVIDNLIDNAVKFAASTIRLRISSTPDHVQLSVIDDGPGIPDADLPYVFERLYVTAQRPVREENSSGLGLAIVRELIEGMGATVLAKGAVGGGTEIVLQFPMVPAQTP